MIHTNPHTYIRDTLEDIRRPFEFRRLAREFDQAKQAGDKKAMAAILRQAKRLDAKRVQPKRKK